MSNYPTTPGIRMAFDADGTRLFRHDALTGALLELGLTAKQVISGQDVTMLKWPARTSGTDSLIVVFPERRDVNGITLFAKWFQSGNNTPSSGQSLGTNVTGTTPSDPTTISTWSAAQRAFMPVNCRVSRDTSTGLDGAWTSTSFQGGTYRSAAGGGFSSISYSEREAANLASSGSIVTDERPRELEPYQGLLNPPFTWASLLQGGFPLYPPQAASATNPDSYPLLRTRIANPPAGDFSGIKGIRFHFEACVDGTYSAPVRGFSNPSTVVIPYLHVQHLALFGQHSPGDVQHKLEFWHPTQPRLLTQADVDQGDATVGQVVTTQFRLKNVSPSKVAQSVEVFMDVVTPTDLTLGNPAPVYAGWQISADGSNYFNGVNVGNVAAGGTVTLTLRRALDDTSSLGVYSPRVAFSVGGWA